MDKYFIYYLPTAENDLLDIFDYISQDNNIAAVKLLNKFDTEIFELQRLPFKGKIPEDRFLRDLNYRMLIIGNYLVFYKVIDNVVEIGRVLHGKRKYSFLL